MRILQVSPFLTSLPMFGGQKRVAAIRKELRRQGFSVSRLDSTWADVGQASVLSEADGIVVALPGAAKDSSLPPMLSDLCLSRFWAGSSEIRNWLPQQDFYKRADAILIEHPWQFEAFRAFEDGKLLIYDAHNIERQVKADSLGLLPNASVMPIADILNDIDAIERLAIQEADLVLGCSVDDVRVIQEQGARSVLFVPNSSSLHEEPVDLGEAQTYAAHTPYCLVVSSAHPPNVQGISDFLQAYLSQARPHPTLVVAGGAAVFFEALATQMPDRLALYPQPSDSQLATLYHHASFVAVPAFSGSGSNLKTFEALFSGRPVVLAESAAIRAGLPREVKGVFLASSPANMAQRLSSLESSPHASSFYSYERNALIEELGWAAGCKRLGQRLASAEILETN